MSYTSTVVFSILYTFRFFSKRKQLILPSHLISSAIEGHSSVLGEGEGEGGEGGEVGGGEGEKVTGRLQSLERILKCLENVSLKLDCLANSLGQSSAYCMHIY